MKFHPLFQTFLIEALENRNRGSQLASSEWKRAGCPVVEEPSVNFGIEVHSHDPYDCMACAKRWLDLDETKKALAATNARIKELEKQFYDPGYVSRLQIENATLETQVGVKDARIKELEQSVADWEADSWREEDLKNRYLAERNAANARIKELERQPKISLAEVTEVARGLAAPVMKGMADDIRNAALEEAANAAEGWVEQPESTFSRLADSIRRLKK